MIVSLKLTKFRIFRYRSIEDSREVSVDEKITTFVGINESGKTNALRALRKLNKDDTKFDESTEQPSWHFRDCKKDENFITATFSLEDHEINDIKNIDKTYGDLQEVSFSKNKNMELICDLKGNVEIAIPYSQFHTKYLQPIITIITTSDFTGIENAKETCASIQENLTRLSIDLENHSNVRKQSSLEQIKGTIETIKPHLDQIKPHPNYPKIENILQKIDSEIIPEKTEKVKNYLIEHMPRFIYFENTGMLNNQINLSSLVKNIHADSLTEVERTTKTLLDLADLDPEELLKLNSEESKNEEQIRKDKDTLSQLCHHKSMSLSQEFDSIWKQNEHSVSIVLNGDYLRLWVTNKRDNLRLQFEERSRGYQWYFSFYVIFNVESENKHKDSILLLDEPALFLHALGQSDFLKKVLPQLAEKNQIIYTTHSPFLLDLDRPDSIHTVTMNKEDDRHESHISDKHWATDKDALFPLQSALGYSLAQNMFIGRNNVIVEGITDFWILDGISKLFIANGEKGLENLVITPVGGATKAVMYATTYVSQELNVGILLDSDNEGKQVRKKLIHNPILKSNKILTVAEAIEKSDDPMSLEDIFPESEYLHFVKLAYANIKDAEIELDSSNPMIVKRIESYFKKNDLGKFDKTLPAFEIIKGLSKMDFNQLNPELISNFKKMFSSINIMMKQ